MFQLQVILTKIWLLVTKKIKNRRFNVPAYHWIFRSLVLKLTCQLLPALKFSNSLTFPEFWIKCWNSLTFPRFFGQISNSWTFPGWVGTLINFCKISFNSSQNLHFPFWMISCLSHVPLREWGKLLFIECMRRKM